MFPITNFTLLFMQLMLNYLQSVTIELSTNKLVTRAISDLVLTTILLHDEVITLSSIDLFLR